LTETLTFISLSFYQLAMSFIGAYAALGVWATSGSSKPKTAEPPIKASSSDEEAFIKEFLAKAESEDKK
jgi:F-type H+-transporting ATPase subunit k